MAKSGGITMLTRCGSISTTAPDSITSVTHLNATQHPENRDIDRKSTRLNSSHRCNSYAVFCLKKKTGRRGPGGQCALPEAPFDGPSVGCGEVGDDARRHDRHTDRGTS